MLRQGVERYRQQALKFGRDRIETLDPVVSQIFSTALESFYSGIENHIAELNLCYHNDRLIERHIGTIMLRGATDALGIDRVAAISGRTIMDSISAKSMAGAVARRIGYRLQRECLMQSILDKDPSWFNVHKHRFGSSSHVHTRHSVQHTDMIIAQWVKSDGNDSKVREWTDRERTAIGTVLIGLFESSTGLIEVINLKSRAGHPLAHVLATPMAGEWIHAWREKYELLKPAYRPMLQPPEDWSTPSDGGFIHKELRRDIVKDPLDAQRAALEVADMPTVYAGINALQRTGWRINQKIFEVMRAWWESGNCKVLPRHDPIEMPPRPQEDDVSPEEWREFRQVVAETHRINNAMRSRRVGFAGVIASAKELVGNSPFYFVHQCDSRSRAYPIGSTSLHPQSNSTAKALLEFHEGKPIRNDEEARAFALRGAALADLGLLTEDEKIQWVRKHDREIMAWADNPFDNRGWMDHGDDQWLLLAWAMDWSAYNRDRGALIHHCATLDATQSGMQILSLLGRDPVGAAQVNCVPMDRPRDMYLAVLEKLPEKIAAGQASDDPLVKAKADVWAQVEMTRSWVKPVVMTRLFNATKFTHTIDLAGKLEHDSGLVLPLRFIYPSSRWMVDQIHEAADEVSGRSMELMRWLSRTASAVTRDGCQFQWTSPAGFPVVQRYTKPKSTAIQTLVNGNAVKRHYTCGEAGLRARKMTTAFAPNFIHSVDAAIMFRVAEIAGFSHFSAAHDCFGTHVSNIPSLKKAIGQAYSEIFSRDLLLELHQEFAGRMATPSTLPKPYKLGDLDITQFGNSDYAFS